MPHVKATACRQCAATKGHTTGLVVAVLLGATAVVLALAATIVTSSAQAEDPGIATRALVRRYYAAVNTALATGDAAGLTAVVAADARVASDAAQVASGRTALAERLAALHVARPELRLLVERVVADKEEAVASVALTGTAAGGPVAVPSAGRETGLVDGFRVRNGTIAELWGATPTLSAPRSVIRTDLDPIGGPVVVGLARVELGPGAEVPVLSGPGPAAIVVEVGRLRVRLDGVGRLNRGIAIGQTAVERTARGVPALLGPGDQLVLGTGVPFGLRNEGEEAAVALLAVVFPLAATAPPAFANAGLEARSLLVEAVRAPDGDANHGWPDGVAVRRLIGRTLAAVPTAPLRLEVERVVLASGTELPAWRSSGHGILAVERGAVLVTTVPAAADGAASAVVVAGDGQTTDIAPGALVSVRGVGDGATLLLCSLAPAASTAADTWTGTRED